MTAALSLAECGFAVHLVEREAELGGNLRHVFTPAGGKDPQLVLKQLKEQIDANDLVHLHLASRIAGSHGFAGNFTSSIEDADGRRSEIQHGATILATGGQEYRGPEYGYGSDERIITQQQFEARLADPEFSAGEVKSVAMIQCVGPAERFCSRICCTTALKNALALKERQPEAQIVVLFKDIRTYGFKEKLYTQARDQGVIFLRYDHQNKPQVNAAGESLAIEAWDPILSRRLTLQPDLLVLSMPVVPRTDNDEIATLFKVPVDADGFFSEAHVKLRPVDFSTDGVFMAGMAHYPKLLDETMIQAQAAAARAARILSRETLTAGGRVAVVDEARCTGCLTCVRICPFGVPVMRANLAGVGDIMGAAYVEPAVCQGCGTCAAECPARAIQLTHYTDAQLRINVRALVQPPAGFVPLENVTAGAE
jgi:heterodisulfide reductase subunit A-like polyferredoxin